MTASRKRFLVATICAALALASAYAQNPCCDLTVDHLQSAGFHLPSYLPTMAEFEHYMQNVLTAHQQLTIDWDSLPGQPKYVAYENVKGMPLSGNFVVIEHKRKIRGASGMGHMTLGAHALVMFGITATSQVRSLWIDWDPRIHGDGQFAVEPHVKMTVYLPEDPKIHAVVFMKPQYTGQKWTLQPIGTLQLPHK